MFRDYSVENKIFRLINKCHQQSWSSRTGQTKGNDTSKNSPYDQVFWCISKSMVNTAYHCQKRAYSMKGPNLNGGPKKRSIKFCISEIVFTLCRTKYFFLQKKVQRKKVFHHKTCLFSKLHFRSSTNVAGCSQNVNAFSSTGNEIGRER